MILGHFLQFPLNFRHFYYIFRSTSDILNIRIWKFRYCSLYISVCSSTTHISGYNFNMVYTFIDFWYFQNLQVSRIWRRNLIFKMWNISYILKCRILVTIVNNLRFYSFLIISKTKISIYVCFYMEIAICNILIQKLLILMYIIQRILITSSQLSFIHFHRLFYTVLK